VFPVSAFWGVAECDSEGRAISLACDRREKFEGPFSPGESI
jgi:hypothetical protein